MEVYFHPQPYLGRLRIPRILPGCDSSLHNFADEHDRLLYDPANVDWRAGTCSNSNSRNQQKQNNRSHAAHKLSRHRKQWILFPTRAVEMNPHRVRSLGLLLFRTLRSPLSTDPTMTRWNSVLSPSADLGSAAKRSGRIAPLVHWRSRAVRIPSFAWVAARHRKSPRQSARTAFHGTHPVDNTQASVTFPRLSGLHRSPKNLQRARIRRKKQFDGKFRQRDIDRTPEDHGCA